MLEFVIGIIGKISVGKSSVAQALSHTTGFPIGSFGLYLRKFSEARGMPIDRESLQNLGEKFVEEDHMLLVHEVIKNSGLDGKVIIEGIRHRVILEDLKAISSNAIFVYLEGSQQTRFRRFSTRTKDSDIFLSEEEFIDRDNHTVESDVSNLKNLCDLIVDTESFDIDQTVRTIWCLIDSQKGATKAG